MEVVIRTDASTTIGAGHVMRCLTLADELRSRGANITFICREHLGHMCSIVEGHGYRVFRLPKADGDFIAGESQGLPPHAEWLALSWEEDARQTLRVFQTELGRADWLVVDHYALDHGWEKKLRSQVEKILVIDDLADRQHDCDLLLDQNYYFDIEGRYEGLVPAYCRRLLGPKYALLRPGFAAAFRTKPLLKEGQIERVFVFFGGVDLGNATGKALSAIEMLGRSDIDVDVVVGAANPNKEVIRKFCEDRKGFHFHCQVSNIEVLMSRADLVIGAGGTTTWERCCLGLPSLVISVAANQEKSARELAESGYQVYLGALEGISLRGLQCAFQTFSQTPQILKFLGLRAQSLVDGFGTDRVVREIVPPPLSLRRATRQDCDSIYAWRNAKETRRHVFDSSAIPYEQHLWWFDSSLNNPDRVILIGEISGRPVGVLRYDFVKTTAVISIYLVPGCQGRGVGTQLIRAGSRWVQDNRPQVEVIRAEVLSENVASARAFLASEYAEHHTVFERVLSQ